MSATAENPALHTITREYMSTTSEHLLVLVQGDMVISTFPADQTDAAIDLARVLCRAIAQPVDLFRVRSCEVESVESGAIAHPVEPGWTHVAHLHFVFLVGVDVVMCDPGLSDTVVERHSTP